MDKYTFILFIFPLLATVNGNITVCLSFDNVQRTTPADDYLRLVKTLKADLTTVLEENDSTFYEHIDFDFDHPAIALKGVLDNVTVENVNNFDLEFFKEIDILKNDIEIFLLTFNNISVVGEYNMTGNIGQLFDIWGDGHFRLNVVNFTVSAATKLPILNSTTKSVCLFLDIHVKLQTMEGRFDNLMDGDPQLEDLINHTVLEIAPEAVDIIWAEFKQVVDGPLEEWINSIINKHSSSIIRQVLHKSQVEV